MQVAEVLLQDSSTRTRLPRDGNRGPENAGPSPNIAGPFQDDGNHRHVKNAIVIEIERGSGQFVQIARDAYLINIFLLRTT